MAAIPEPRLQPLSPDEWPEGMKAALGALRPPSPRLPFPKADPNRPKGLGALGLLAHHVELATAYNTFNGHILFATTLSARQRELIVLRVAARRGSEYEWAQHAILAGDVGLSAVEVSRIADGPDAAGWSSVDAALLRAVDELLDDACIGDATWTELAAAFDARQLMDVVFTVGAYDVLAMAFRTFGLALDDDLQR